MASEPSPGGVIAAQLTESGAEVELSVVEPVPAELWAAVRRSLNAQWTSATRGPAMVASAERFLSQRSWLQSRLHSYRTGIIIQGVELRELLTRTTAVANQLAPILERSNSIADTEVGVRRELEATRFDFEKRDPREFQLEALVRLLAMPNGANFSVPGSGKTTTTLALYELLRARGVVDRMLVVAPLSAHEAWLEEAAECFTPPIQAQRFGSRGPLTEIVVITYQSLTPRLHEVVRWIAGGRTHIVLDEAHRIKRGSPGQWAKACLSLAPLAMRRDILTGTPAPQAPRDLFAEFEFLWPGQQNTILEPIVGDSQPSSERLRSLSHRIQPLFVRTPKRALGLPNPVTRAVPVTMGPIQESIYRRMRTSARVAARGSRDRRLQTMGGIVTHLIQAASNPAILSRALDGGEAARHQWPPLGQVLTGDEAEMVRNYGRLEMPEKYVALAALVEENVADNRKTLVWTNYIDSIKILENQILAAGNPAVIYGAIPSGDEDADFRTRESELRRFRTDPNCTVLIANPAAMSEGVSLHTVCRDAIYVDRTFNAGQYLQSVDRIHRLGMSRDEPVRIKFLLSESTVDEVVDARVRLKAEALGDILSDPDIVTMALPDDNDPGESYDDADLDALFAHLSQTDESAW